MKPLFVKLPDLLAKLLPERYYAINVFGFIVFYVDELRLTERSKRHETIHMYQWFEMMVLTGIVLSFFAGAGKIDHQWILLAVVAWQIYWHVEWCIRRVSTDTWHEAYKAISMEIESRHGDSIKDYPEDRDWFAWIRFL